MNKVEFCEESFDGECKKGTVEVLNLDHAKVFATNWTEACPEGRTRSVTVKTSDGKTLGFSKSFQKFIPRIHRQ